VRFLTLNLWGRRGEWERRRQILIAGLLTLQPDIVAFQESVKTDSYDQALDVLGPEYHLVHQTTREPGGPGDVEAGQGISIASRWPVTLLRELELRVTPRTANFACGALIAEVRAPLPIGSLLFVNHFPNWQLSFEYERELQAVVTATAIEELAEHGPSHAVVVGDLDADPSAASIRFWTGRQSLDRMSVCYRDAWESTRPGEQGKTFTRRNPLMNAWDWPFGRIDYILVRCGLHGGPTLEIQNCSLAFDAPIDGLWATDHFGVVADLAVPSR
jgi:endonuclease/exonuclease/phosphatase family metal-dependent hydrolase